MTYKVRVYRERWECECAFFAETKQACIHILAVCFREGFKSSPIAAPPTNPACERRKSGDVILSGKRRNKSGTVSRYLCNACGLRFTGRDGFQRRRQDPEKIALALDLYFRGVSVRKVADHLEQVYSLKVSSATVYNWIAYFGKIAAEWMARQGEKVGETWHVDERVVNVNGENHYLWNVMDSETRFLLASRISEGRGIPEDRAAFKDAKRTTEVRPTELRSDGYPGYPEAVKREFGRYRKPGDAPGTFGAGCRSMWTPHTVVPSIRAPESNNILERLNGTSKDRTKVMRAYDNDRGADALSRGWQVHYNLVRPHLALGMTPGEAAGITPIGGFRWREIIEAAARDLRVESPAAPDFRTRPIEAQGNSRE